MKKSTKPKQRTLKEIAAAIDKHLKRIEADPKLNPCKQYDTKRKRWVRMGPGDGVSDYFYALAYSAGSRVMVKYVSYQGVTSLTREQAELYLAALDAGKVGRHFELIRDAIK